MTSLRLTPLAVAPEPPIRQYGAARALVLDVLRDIILLYAPGAG